MCSIERRSICFLDCHMNNGDCPQKEKLFWFHQIVRSHVLLGPLDPTVETQPFWLFNGIIMDESWPKLPHCSSRRGKVFYKIFKYEKTQWTCVRGSRNTGHPMPVRQKGKLMCPWHSRGWNPSCHLFIWPISIRCITSVSGDIRLAPAGSHQQANNIWSIL